MYTIFIHFFSFFLLMQGNSAAMIALDMGEKKLARYLQGK